MAKLGYTWYPKDWNNSEAVFELTLQQRGLYRELIDLAMLNDNTTIINLKIWSRKWDVSEEALASLLGQLSHIDLIEVDGNNLFIPSCESRLNLVRGGSNGGKKSKPTPKPIVKPTPKPDSNQKKDKVKEKESKELSFDEKKAKFIEWFNNQKRKHTGTLGKFKILSKQDDNNLKKLFKDYTFADFEIASSNLFISKWAIENNGLTPSHFLRVDNFNKYLNQVKAVKKLNTFD